MGSPAPGNSPRLAASGQGSPLRGLPSQGAFSSPQGSPNTSAAFSPGSLAAASESPASYSGSVASPAQSSPERAYSTQMSQGREADHPVQSREEQAGQMSQVMLQLISSGHSVSWEPEREQQTEYATCDRHMLQTAFMFLQSTNEMYLYNVF